jgi:hypothetical protein
VQYTADTDILKVQHPSDRDVLKVIWFHKMMTQVPEA